MLYQQAEKEKIPFHKWSEWLYNVIKQKSEACKKNIANSQNIRRQSVMQTAKPKL